MSASIRIFALTLLAVASFVGRSTSLDTRAETASTITQATFEPVYRASKAIQGAAGPGVTYAEFGELLHALSREVAIAKDHKMTGLDRKLLALFEEALAAYNVSANLWKTKIPADDESNALPPTAIQQMWTKADDSIRRATEIYYGRSSDPLR